jgi:hemolysin activation/secretion protein
MSLAGDVRDALLAGAVNTWNVGWTSGSVSFDNVVAQVADAAAANTQGSFSKWNVSLARLQGLSSKDELYLAFSGQGASNNLDPSEKMIAGGPYTVRAYDMGAISGDTGFLLTAEFRHDLGQAWQGRQWQVVGFVDSEQVTINKNAWVAGTNSATLSGGGLGLNWTGPKKWSARAYIANPLGSAPMGSTASVHEWVEINKNF